jgi:hypothetical protein
MSANSVSMVGADFRLGGLVVISACILLLLASLRNRGDGPTAENRRRSSPPTARVAVQPVERPAPDQRASARGSNPGLDPALTITRPLAPELHVEEQHSLDATLQEHGVNRLAERMQSSRRERFARDAADQQIRALASEGVVVELDLLLGGSWVPHTLLTRTGAYAVLPLDGSMDDAATVHAILRDLPAADAIVRDLRSLLSAQLEYATKVVFLCPYSDESPRIWHGPRGGEVWTIGGTKQLQAWLASQPGPRISAELLGLLRQGAKPRRATSGSSISAHAGAPRG